MKNYKIIPQITLWVLLAVGILCTVMFYWPVSEGSIEVAGDYLNIPKYTNMMLVWNYTLLALACLTTLCFVIVRFIELLRSDIKRAMIDLVVVIGFVGLILICWFMGSPDTVHIVGYEGTDNAGAMAQLSDACLYLSYILLAATILTVAGGWIYTKCLK